MQFRIWEGAGVCTHVLEGHGDAITSVGIVKTTGAICYKFIILVIMYLMNN